MSQLMNIILNAISLSLIVPISGLWEITVIDY